MSKSEGSPNATDERPPPPSAPPPRRGQQLPYHLPTMNVPIVVFWILPLFFIAMFSRNIADVSPKEIPVNPPSPRPKPTPRTAPTPAAPTKNVAELPSAWPVDYRKQLKIIQKRRRSIPGFLGNIHNELEQLEPPATKDSKPKRQPSAPTANAPDNANTPRLRLQERIAQLVQEYHDHDDDLLRGIMAADAMRMYDLQYHEGGTYEQPAIALYHELLPKATARREHLMAEGKPTKYGLTCNGETTLEYGDKSADGLLCALYTSLGKILYMSNMFERAVEAYDGCLKGIDPGYLDAKNSRGSSLIVLGRYEEAAKDFAEVIEMDTQRLFIDAFTGLARVLEAKEEVVEGGWDTVVDPINQLLSILSSHHQGEDPNVASVLGRLHHVLFTYHEAKTKAYDTAFHHLSESHKFKLSTLTKWSGDMERMKVQQLKSIFRSGFWSQGTGSSTKVPIFIIGFVRSGSTLLERILDAHPSIAGTGENSVFNGRLDDIRNQIVKASNTGGDLTSVTKRLGEEVVEEMERRWKVVDSNTDTDHDGKQPLRLADKMLTNYYNVGFIEMLYPNALILHVAREPMDSIFSAFKHNFPTGTLDYTSDMTGVADLYEAYRAVMDHWDEVLPGRITHIRYEDMVNDFEGMARAIIAATGLPWHDDVLQFHKKKHAVNTYSSTQVRKGIYKSSMKSWMRYEDELKPLVKKVGDRVKYDLKTSVPGYRKPPSQTE